MPTGRQATAAPDADLCDVCKLGIRVVVSLPQWRGNPNLGPGLGLIDGFVVVPHFDGGRSTWVRAGLTAAPAVRGIPENSGVIVEG